MPWPSNYAQVMVHGAWFDPFGNAMGGYVTFEPTVEIYDVAGQKIVSPAISGVPLVNGAFSVYLLATDEPNVTPKGWQYRVTASVLGGGQFMLSVPKDSGTLDLAQYKASLPTRPGDQPTPDHFATIAALSGERALRIAGDNARIPWSAKGAPGGVAELDEDGFIPPSQIDTGDFVVSGQVGIPNGIAQLGANGIVPSTQLPQPITFVQSTPSARWEIPYSYPNKPDVEVYDNNDDIVVADVDLGTANKVIVRTHFPETGKAILRW